MQPPEVRFGFIRRALPAELPGEFVRLCAKLLGKRSIQGQMSHSFRECDLIVRRKQDSRSAILYRFSQTGRIGRDGWRSAGGSFDIRDSPALFWRWEHVRP